MNKLITKEEAIQRIKDSNIQLPHGEHDIIIISREEREAANHLDWWEARNEPHLLLPFFIVDERYLCFVDVGYGFDVVIDLKTHKVYWSKDGIFEEDFVFLSDYYGFQKGAFYNRNV